MTLPELDLFGPPVRVPELRDVTLTPRVRLVVDHPDFQRLRRVRQLGPTHLVYPGATHTRFEHSLGAYGCAQMFLRSLLRRPAFVDSVQEIDLLTCLLSALLHDVGHYPYAHSLEAVHLPGQDTPRHEDLAATVIRRGIGDVLQSDLGLDPERVIRLIQVKHSQQDTPVDAILASVISSAIDCDKMDYLERDSTHLGVPYGRSFDRSRLIAALTLNEAENGIAVEAGGKIPAEMFVFSRYMMFSEAYWHHTVRAASAMMEVAMRDFVGTPGVAAHLETTLLSQSDDQLLETIASTCPVDSPGQVLARGVLNRRLYKRVATFSRAYVEPEKQEAYSRLYAMDTDNLAATTERIASALSQLLGQSVAPADVLIDTPPRDKDHPETLDVRYDGVRGQSSYPLHELSRIVAGVHSDFVAVVKKIRVFVAPELALRVRQHQHPAEKAILGAISP
ncbi:MAG: HD superfamily phosphohydrolase [Myxococcota bacterium]|jgi:HD superfamily phosphohydrolase